MKPARSIRPVRLVAFCGCPEGGDWEYGLCVYGRVWVAA